MKFKAAILDEIDSPLIVDDIELSKLEVGQVLVKIHYSGICGSQLAEISGAKGSDNFLPHLLGHEGSGVVVEMGAGISIFKKGDRVVAHWREGKGIDAEFPVYKWGNKVVGGGKVTTFSEYAVVSENRLTKVDKDTPLELAALMGCSVTTAWGLINNEAQLKIGQSIIVIGCGNVGLNIIVGAKMVSAYPIICIDRHEGKLEQALNCGATSATSSDFGIEADVVVDCTGSPEMIEKGWKMVASGGKMILVGQPHNGASYNFTKVREGFYKNKKMFDSQGGMTNPTVDIPRYLNLIKSSGLGYGQPSMYDLESVNNAIRDLEQGVVGKIMLEMNT